jgi:hypothetical protein
MQIDQRFLRGGEEITLGKTLQFEHASVEVVSIKEDPPSPADVRIIQDMPANQKMLHWQRPESSFQGSVQPQPTVVWLVSTKEIVLIIYYCCT